jgi:Cd2+/Zn2+-exporting ATPase
VVLLEEVRSGDLVLIRSGDRIPVDGTVVMGSASVNQAAITGESLAVEKQVGGLVYAGTLNEIGALEIQATSVGAETKLAHIRRMVAEAQAQKAPIERILDRYARFYTPAALRGSLVKKGATIEALAQVNAVAFDKTGTLTEGQPKLTTVFPLSGMDEQELLRVAAIAEKFSEHPLGRAIVQAATEQGLAYRSR